MNCFCVCFATSFKFLEFTLHEWLHLSLKERRFVFKQLTWGEDLDLVIDTSVAVNVSTSPGPNDSV